MNIKDLPQDKLRLIDAADPSFDYRISAEFNNTSNEVIESLKPFSVFLENSGERPVVAYVIQWCFTRKDGRNQYHRKVLMDPQAFIDGANFSQELRQQQGWIEPDSTKFISMLSSDVGMLNTPVSANEAEEFRQGKRPDPALLLRRSRVEASKFSEITVSIDAAFFDDGTFVGPDTSNFFAQTKAVLDAKQDLLNEIEMGLSNPATSTDLLYRRIQETADQTTKPIDSESTPADYYNYFKQYYASDLLQTKKNAWKG